jgi:hypothetical protein
LAIKSSMTSNKPKKAAEATSSNNAAASPLKVREYPQIFNSNIDLVLLNSSIVSIPIEIDALVNCTGPKFEHAGMFFVI